MDSFFVKWVDSNEICLCVIDSWRDESIIDQFYIWSTNGCIEQFFSFITQASEDALGQPLVTRVLDMNGKVEIRFWLVVWIEIELVQELGFETGKKREANSKVWFWGVVLGNFYMVLQVMIICLHLSIFYYSIRVGKN